jgi:phenylacetate-CoA ligase
MTHSVFLELQQRKLREVFPYICRTPFYREKLSDSANDVDYDNPLAGFGRLPFTYKDELRSTSPMRRTPLSVQELMAFFSSSGTTGQPSVYAWSRTDQCVSEEISSRLLHHIGVGSGDIALLPAPMGMPIAWYIMISEMLAVGAAFVPLGPVPLKRIAQALVSYPITILKIPPVMASRLFRFIVETDASLLSKMRLRQIHLAGHFASDARKRRLENQWGVSCYDMYGISEIGLLAGECPTKDGQHFCADYVLVEVIDPETRRPAPSGQEGVGVYTSLWEKATPLLRYWSDDYIVVDDSPCPCGLNLPQLTFRGRGIDSVKLGERRIFASDVESILLSDDRVGDEFLVEVHGNQEQSRCTVQVESLGSVIPTSSLEGRLCDLLQTRVELQISPPRVFDKTSVKPLRIIDRRSLPE